MILLADEDEEEFVIEACQEGSRPADEEEQGAKILEGPDDVSRMM
jgi:hypothetical protein